MDARYDALLVVSFGGPEGPDDVLPFLENVVRGKRVPRARLREVAEHYHQFGGVSPLNAHNRALIKALGAELDAHGPRLPIYWGNRNWHPLLPDTLAKMAADGIERALAFVTSAYSSYSSCRQYLEDIERARETVGRRAPRVDKLRAFYNHPGFIEAMADRVREALEQFPSKRRGAVQVLFTAHSIPAAMAQGCRYEAQLHEVARLVSQRIGQQPWRVVYQSRSGPPGQPWLEPDVCDCLRQLAANQPRRDVLLAPIGFVTDHLEVVYDLDTEAGALCAELGIRMVRAGTPGIHSRFVSMIRQLVVERMTTEPVRLALGRHGPSHDMCPSDCCPAGVVPVVSSERSAARQGT